MKIPLYRAKALRNHLKRVASHAVAAANDHRTADALRLAIADVRWLEKLIARYEQEHPAASPGSPARKGSHA
ncbi:hypothetical protein [uncultured Muribaculum sp.]|uniref:hypothetical protein n=1 Tax=uncultured Muribaculum sp. TaxID=1918613 RepID=UPI00272EE8B4|nr:hypothetical protein [uncultured Muribaculum sp.]